MAIKTKNQGWMQKKFKTVDTVIGESGEENKKIEKLKELDEMGKFVEVEKLPVLREKQEFDDVVILSEETKVRGSVC